MKHRAKISYELSLDEIKKVIISALRLENNAKVEFKMTDVSVNGVQRNYVSAILGD